MIKVPPSSSERTVDLSISIVNTSNWKYLEPCLRSIAESTREIRYEILVVDNASDDGSRQLIADNFPDVILTTNARRYGFATNNNINMRKGSGRYLMLLNDDTLVLPSSLDNAVRYLDANPDTGMIGCQMLNPDGTIQFSSGRLSLRLLDVLWAETGLSAVWSRSPIFARRIIGDWDHNTVREIDLPQESGMIVRRSAIDEVGLLDEGFFMFGEGADWCRRIKKAGWKIVFLPSSPIVHFGGVTNQRASLRMYLQGYKSTYIYFRKENKTRSLAYRILILLTSLAKSVVAGLGQLLGVRKAKRYADVLAYYRALLCLMAFRLHDADYPFETTTPEDLVGRSR